MWMMGLLLLLFVVVVLLLLLLLVERGLLRMAVELQLKSSGLLL
jgi:hypothetical protein